MKLAVIVIAAIAVLGVVFMIANQGGGAPGLTFQTVQADIVSGGQLIDVRTPAEYSSSHIDGAINLSLQDIQQGSVPSVSKDKPVYLYCHSGSRSGQATRVLKAAGYQNIVDLGAIAHVQAMGGLIK